MNRRIFRSGAAIALVVCLSAAPLASARQSRDTDPVLRERIVRIVKSIQKFFNITSDDDSIQPPRP